MTITITKLYEILSSQIGKESAENLTNFVELKIKDDLENKTQIFSTKEDLANVKSELKSDIHQAKMDMIKWMFAFWVTALLAIVGLYFK